MTKTYDIVIVGSGINGAVIAQRVLELSPTTSILMLEAGQEITGVLGEHLVEVDENAMNASYETLMRRARQIEYVKGATSMNQIEGDVWDKDSPGIFPAAFLGHDFSQFPGASIAWNIGGMGVHWTAACPWPYASEVPAFLPGNEWDEDIAVSRRLLRVCEGPLVENPFTAPVFAALRSVVPSPDSSREVGYMPMAGVPREGRPFARTGPLDIAPLFFEGNTPNTTLVSGTLCTRIITDDAVVTGIVGRDVVTGAEEVYVGAQYVIAADALRTPQLLWASGIRPSALGVRLNEHATVDGDVIIDAARFGLSNEDVPVPPAGEPFLGAYWSPSIGDTRPTHGQLMERAIPGRGHVLGMGWYCPTEIRPENRIEFSERATDALGMPHMTVHFSYSDADRAQICRTQDVQRAAARSIGDFTDEETEVLPPGASLHYTGTVRMGARDDGTSVCDPNGHLWGYENLYVAGNGVIPTALTCNATLAGATLSIRTARALANFTAR